MISIRSEEGRGPLASSTSNELVHSPQRIFQTLSDVSSSHMVLADRALSTVPRRGPGLFASSFPSIFDDPLRHVSGGGPPDPSFQSRGGADVRIACGRLPTTRAVASTCTCWTTCRRATRLFVGSRKARCLCHRSGRTIRRCRRHGWRCWIPTPDTRTTGIRSRTSPRTIDQEKTRRCRRHLLRQDRRRTKKG